MAPLDVEALLAPISKPPPLNEVRQGVVLVRGKLKVNRESDDPDAFPENDPRRKNPRKADWPGIVSQGRELLTTKAKDLETAARMTEALVRLHGFPGLRDGLRLLRGLVEKCWERLYYPADEEGPAANGEAPKEAKLPADFAELQAAPFTLLDGNDTGLFFPATIRAVPIVASEEEGTAFSYLDWKQAQDPKGKVSWAQWEKAVLETSLERCEQTGKALDEGLQELQKLEAVLKAKMGKDAPSLNNVREAVQDCQKLVQPILVKKRPVPPPKEDKPPEQSAQPAGVVPPKPTAVTRDSIYKQLSQLADQLGKLEPHSPVPFLIRRAVDLGMMPFPDLMKDLVREPKILQDMFRELGHKEAAPPPAKK